MELEFDNVKYIGENTNSAYNNALNATLDVNSIYSIFYPISLKISKTLKLDLF